MNAFILRASLLLGTLLLVCACGKVMSPPEPPRPVLTSIIGASDESGVASYSGEVRSRFETSLGFRIPGKIVARLVDAGAQVKAGDVPFSYTHLDVYKRQPVVLPADPVADRSPDGR